MPYLAADDRYAAMEYRRTGRSGVLLPVVSLGLWHNFGDTSPLETQRAVLRRAFDRGVVHIDLANNYGPPAGSAESNFGTVFAQDFPPYRDELFISTKAGYHMWPGPYGEWGSRKYLLWILTSPSAAWASTTSTSSTPTASTRTRRSRRRWARWTPRSAGQGALRRHLLLLGRAHRRATAILRDLGTPLLIHQASYSILHR